MKLGTKKGHNVENVHIARGVLFDVFLKEVRAPVSIIYAGVSCTSLEVPYL